MATIARYAARRRRRSMSRILVADRCARPATLVRVPAILVANGSSTLPEGAPRRAPLPPRRGGDAGDHVEHRPRAGHQAADARLLGVPRHDHGVREAGPELRRLPSAVPLDRADPELADRG